MANPQKENGHTSIANELMEVLAKTEFTAGEFRVLFVIWRKTWGWHKKSDWISLSQLANLTGFSERTICKIKKKLLSCRAVVIIKEKIMFNKNYEEWGLPHGADPALQGTTPCPAGYKPLPPRADTKETNTKETNTKETNTKGLKILKEKMRQLGKLK